MSLYPGDSPDNPNGHLSLPQSPGNPNGNPPPSRAPQPTGWGSWLNPTNGTDWMILAAVIAIPGAFIVWLLFRRKK